MVGWWLLLLVYFRDDLRGPSCDSRFCSCGYNSVLIYRCGGDSRLMYIRDDVYICSLTASIL